MAEGACDKPAPDGWRCTRGQHEDGPCALVPPLVEAIQTALAEVLHAHDGSIPSRWVIVAESLEQDGSTKTWAVGNDSLSSWEMLGMYAYGTQVIQARVMAAEMREQAEE